MTGWKLALGIGALCIALAIGAVALNGPSSKSEQKPRFGGLNYQRSGGFAGFDDRIRIDSKMRVTATNRVEARDVQLTPAQSRRLLRALDQLAKHPASKQSSTDTPPYPDQLTTEMSFIWNGKTVHVDQSLPEADDVAELITP